jgi:O-antigen ligase
VSPTRDAAAALPPLPKIHPMAATAARPRALVAGVLAIAALLVGPLAALAVDVDPVALAIVGGFIVVALLTAAGLRGVDLALLAINLGAIAFFTAIRHRAVGTVNPPHPFYDWTFLRMTAPELLTLAAFAAHALRHVTTHDAAPVRVGPVPLLIGAFLAIGLLVGLVRGNSIEQCLRDSRKVAYVALAHLLIVRIADTPARRQIVLRVVALALVATSVATVAAYFAGEGFRYNGFLRASVDVSDFLGFLALICVPAALLRAAPGSAGRRALLILLIAIGSAATLATFSRAAWCAAPIGLAVVALHPLGTARRLPRVALALALLAAAGAPLLFSGIADRALARVEALFDRNGDPSVTYRVRELRGAVDVALDHPVAGIGFGTAFDAGAAIIDRRRGSATLVHNLFVWSAIKAGLPGLVLMAGVLLFALAQLSRGARRGVDPGEAGLALGLLGLVATFLVIGMVGAMLNQARTAFLLGTVTGLAQSLASARRSAFAPTPAAQAARSRSFSRPVLANGLASPAP